MDNKIKNIENQEIENKKILIGMSGGVDSSVAAYLLQKEGYEVVGVTLLLWDDNNSNKSIEDAKIVCDKLNIKHYVFDCKEEFKKYVVNDFVENYKECKTPNPCIKCNKFFKFGVMFEVAKKLGIEYIATGHYSRVEYDERYDRYVLRKANNERKDQSYFLYNIPSEKLKYVKFPLASYEEKDELRKIAEDNNLITARKKDSQDICFIQDGDYVAFLKENGNLEIKEGNIVNKDGKILGRHKGLISYTIGKRKGLGIGGGTVYYVTGFNIDKNELIVGTEDELYSSKCTITDVNLMLFDKLIEDKKVYVKIRYASKPVLATIKISENNEDIDIIFEEKVKSITKGQSAVFYTEDGIVIGGGIIK